MGVADSYHATPVGVYFGEPGKQVADPFFGGAGPDRTGCTECGSCMTGCRVGAKNTLVKNYLYLAEQGGAHVVPMTTVTAVRPRGDRCFEVDLRQTGTTSKRFTATVTAGHVVMAAGTWGTQKLLHAMRDNGTLPRLSTRLGELTRTNSEAILGAARTSGDPVNDYSRGVAITSSIHPDENTHIEPVRYGKGSNAMSLLQTTAPAPARPSRGPATGYSRGVAITSSIPPDENTHVEPVRYGKGSNAMSLLQTIATDGSLAEPRWKQLAKYMIKHPVKCLKMLNGY